MAHSKHTEQPKKPPSHVLARAWAGSLKVPEWLYQAWLRDPISVIVLFTTIFLTLFTGLQWRALITSEKNSERAWVIISAAGLLMPLDVGVSPEGRSTS